MRVKTIPVSLLKDKQTGNALPDHYKGEQIVELVGLTTKGRLPALVCMVDETKQQECDHFALVDGQQYEPTLLSPGGDPINDRPPKVLGMVKNATGAVIVVSSYCFA